LAQGRDKAETWTGFADCPAMERSRERQDAENCPETLLTAGSSAAKRDAKFPDP